MDSERVLSILKGREGWNEEYSSIYEFKHHLDEGSDLGEEKLEWGWVLYERQLGPHPLLTLLKHIASHSFLMRHCIVQFWAVAKMEGPHHYLSTSNQCFCVGKLNKGVCWYRKLCSGHVYVVDMEGGDDEVIGSVGRAYRNKYPETTPDLRLYGGDEYPMWVGAARCGFRSYMALPLFDVHMTTCYGVLELLFHRLIKPTHLIPSLDQGLQISGLRSTHNSNSMPSFTAEMQHREGEITEVLELAAITVPRLYLTQVWVLCKQCGNSRCLERSSFLLNSDNDLINSWCLDIDLDMYTYLKACELHTLQIDSNLGHLSISKNPLAHYAQRARVSQSFAISLQIADMNSSNNHLYVLQFFLRPKRREDACDYSLQMLLRIMEMNFQSFKLVSDGKILEEHRQNPNKAIPCESIDSLKAIKSYKQSFSEPNLVEYLEISVDVVFRCIRPSSVGKGWVFCGDNINGGSSSTSIAIKEKVEDFMKKIAAQPRKHCQWIVQFWAPKMGHLQTSDQPYALGCLAKGLASFRKKCMKHYYFVGDDAEEEELGPPGRVFRSGHPEISPDLFLYTRSEFPIRNYAMHCFGRGYFALPIYLLNDEHDHKCVGVLEFVGFIFSELYGIGKTLKEAKLCSTHIDFKPRFSFDAHVVNNNSGKDVSTELSGGAIKQIYNGIPQLHMAKVWVPYGECISNSDRSRTACCMALLSSTNDIDSFLPTDEVHWIHVQPKKGIIGMLLASENNACFCRNLCEFTIADHPLSHFEMSRRCDACFAMCLQSSHTGDLVYVVEFFLIQGPATYEYLRSFLNFLLPMMKHELKSFKLAFGKELGEEMVVEVIEFCDADRLLGSSESKEADFFPIKFKSVQYSRRNAQEQDSKTREKGKRRKRFNLSLEVLKLNFGKKLKVVAEELGIGRSTIKRACREHGIDRWPSKENRKMNTSLSLSGNSQQERSTHHHHLVMTEEEVEKVIIKVEYEEDVIKFELDLSLGVVDKLTEKVASKLNLEMGSFKLKYWDEDEDEILLTCDDDLLLCPKTHTAKGQRCMQFFVQFISE